MRNPFNVVSFRFVARFLVVAFLIGLLGPIAAAPPVYGATITVNSTGDAPWNNAQPNICGTTTGGATECTLRAAIQMANATAGANTINFNLTGSTGNIITPLSELPALTNPAGIIIDGYTNPSYPGLTGPAKNTNPSGNFNGSVVVGIRGSSCIGCHGLTLNSNNHKISGLSIFDFVGGAAIRIMSSASNSSIVGNIIGIEPGSTPSLQTQNRYGVIIDDGAATSNAIGRGPGFPNDRNVILRSTVANVRLGANSGNSVAGNVIGATPSQTSQGSVPAPLGPDAQQPPTANGPYPFGILLYGTSNTVIGSSNVSSSNVILGLGVGIVLSGGAVSNSIFGNHIGLLQSSANSTSTLQNFRGVLATGGASSNCIGDCPGGSGGANYIAGNAEGVYIENNATLNHVGGNTIGASQDKSAAVGNSGSGVTIASNQNQVRYNYIRAGGNAGVLLKSSNSLVEVNEIRDGGTVSVGLGAGVLIQTGDGGALAQKNIVKLNTITGNRGPGVQVGVVAVDSSTVTGNWITQNSFLNNSIGIDLRGDDVTNNSFQSPPPNPRTGPNGLLRFPDILSYGPSGSGTYIVSGKVNDVRCQNGATCTVEVYAANVHGGPSGTIAEGQTYRGAVLTGPDGSWVFQDSQPLSAITALAIEPGAFANTSEFTQPAFNLNTQASLSVTKTSSAGSGVITNGQSLNYTINVSNGGPGVSINTRMTDTLPTGFTYTSASQGVSVNGQVVTYNFGSLNASASASVTINGTVNATSGTLTNSVTVGNDQGSTATASASNSFTTSGSLSVAQTGSPTANAGGNVSYTVTASNGGSAALQNVVVTYVFPTGVTPTSGGAINGQTVTVSLGQLNGNSSTPTTITGQVGSSVANNTQLNMQASATATGVSQATSNTIVLTVSNTTTSGSLTVAKSQTSTGAVVGGAQLVYNIQVTNGTNQTLTNVTVTDTIPAFTTFVSADGSYTSSNNVVTWNIGQLTSGQVGAVNLTVLINYNTFSGTIQNTAYASAQNVAQVASNTVTSTIGGSGQGGSGPLTLTKSASTTSNAFPGSTIFYTINYQNNSGVTQNNVIIYDTIPANTTLVLGSGNFGQQFGSQIQWNIGSVQAGTGSSVSFSVTINTFITNGAVITNQATATSSSGNSTSNTVTTIVGQGNTGGYYGSGQLLLTLTATPPQGVVLANQPIQYIITVNNVSGGVLSNVQVTDILPPQLTPQQSSGLISGYTPTYNGQQVTWYIPQLTQGAPVTLYLSAIVNGALSANGTTFTNTVTASAGGFAAQTASLTHSVYGSAIIGGQPLPLGYPAPVPAPAPAPVAAPVPVTAGVPVPGSTPLAVITNTTATPAVTAAQPSATPAAAAAAPSGPQTRANAVSYNASTATGSMLYMPWVANSSNLASSISLLNTGSGAVDVTLNFYPFDANAPAPPPLKLASTEASEAVTWTTRAADAAGAPAPVTLRGIAANASTTVPTSQLPTGFIGAVIASTANGAISGVVQTKRSGGQLDDFGYPAIPNTVATGASAATVNLPLLFRNYFAWNSDVTVLNVGTAPAEVTVTYRSADPSQSGQTWTETATIQPNQAKWFILANSTSGLPDNWVGSAVFTAKNDQPLVAVATEINSSVSAAMSYPGIYGFQAASSLRAPLLMKANNDWDTGMQIQNVGTADATVTVTYTASGQSAPAGTDTATLKPGESRTFFTPSAPGLPEKFVGSAVVVGDNNAQLVGMVNQSRYKFGAGMAYLMLGLTSGSTKISAPFTRKANDGFNTGVQVQNFGDVASAVTVTFYDEAGTQVGQLSDSIPASGSITFYLPALTQVPANFRGSVVVQSTNNQPLAAIINDVKYFQTTN